MLDCYLNTAPTEDSNGEGQTCTPAVLAPYLIDALHMYYQILSSFMPTGTPMADELQYDQCLGKFDINFVCLVNFHTFVAVC